VRDHPTLRRFLHDRGSLLAAFILVVVVVASFAGGPIASTLLGHDGSDLFPYSVNENLRPVGPWTHVPALYQAASLPDNSVAPPPKNVKRTLFILGADSDVGRDEFIRLLDGGKASLEIGLGGVLVALLVGVPLGALAGFFGGWIDAVVSRLTELVMAFPLILLLVLVSVRLRPTLEPIAIRHVLPPGVLEVALTIGLFTSFYPLRLVRSLMLTLRHAEFVEAERMIGASNRRIIVRHLLPHLVPTLLVWGAVAVGTNILLEVGLSFIGAGVPLTTTTWGSMLVTTWGTIYSPHVYNAQAFTPWLTLFPTLAILIAVVSLNRVSEGTRRALAPREL
jgi:peptide/nickel transport system permease protein/oligopeptide transport system permease protein